MIKQQKASKKKQDQLDGIIAIKFTALNELLLD